MFRQGRLSKGVKDVIGGARPSHCPRCGEERALDLPSSLARTIAHDLAQLDSLDRSPAADEKDQKVQGCNGNADRSSVCIATRLYLNLLPAPLVCDGSVSSDSESALQCSCVWPSLLPRTRACKRALFRIIPWPSCGRSCMYEERRCQVCSSSQWRGMNCVTVQPHGVIGSCLPSLLQ